ncbi:MAG: hypothetical protein WEC37_01115 [Anaerolineales bacterium]
MIFVIPPAKPIKIKKGIGSINDGDEKLSSYGNVIFWSITAKAYGRSQVVRMFNTKAYEDITLRSSTTAKKLYKLIKHSAK